MTATAINQAITEACGQHYHKPADEEIKRGSYYQFEPDYCGDLNLVRDAVLQLFPNKVEQGFYHPSWNSLMDNLKVATGGTPNHWNEPALMLASAEQWSKAIVTTLGKWTNG